MKKSFWIAMLALVASAAAWAQMSPMEAEAERARLAQAEQKHQFFPVRQQAPQGQAAQADDRWISLGQPPQQLCVASLCITSLYVDKQTVQYGPGWRSATLWIKWAYSDGGYGLTKLELEQSGRVRILANRAIDAGGTEQYSDDVATPWTQIAPGTLEEGLYNATIRDVQIRAAQNQAQIQAEIERRIKLQHAWRYLGCLSAGMANSGQLSLPLAFSSAVGQCQ